MPWAWKWAVAASTSCVSCSMPTTSRAPVSRAARLNRPSWLARSRTRAPSSSARWSWSSTRYRALMRASDGPVLLGSPNSGNESKKRLGSGAGVMGRRPLLGVIRPPVSPSLRRRGRSPTVSAPHAGSFTRAVSDRGDAMTADGFSGKRAAEIVGITYRQLDYWARTDLIRPSLADAQGSGSRRRYSYRNLLELKVIKTLLDAGIKLESVRGAFSYLRENLGEDVASAQLVICGTSAVLVRDGQELIDVVNRTRGQGVLNLLALDDVRSQVDDAIEFEQRRPE